MKEPNTRPIDQVISDFTETIHNINKRIPAGTHFKDDHRFTLDQVAKDNFEGENQQVLLEANISTRVKFARTPKTEQEIRQDQQSTLKQSWNKTLGSFFHVYHDLGVQITPEEEATINAASTTQAIQQPTYEASIEDNMNRVFDAMGQANELRRFPDKDTVEMLIEFKKTGEHPELLKDIQQHPYVANKFTCYNAYCDSLNITIPQYVNTDDGLELCGTQKINKDKRFSAGHKTSGAFAIIGDVAGATKLLVVEGWKTGCYVHTATEIPVVIAGSDNNIASVLLTIAERVGAFSEIEGVVICADVGTNKKVEQARQMAWHYSELPTAAVYPDSTEKNFDFADMVEAYAA